jgi:hypothetical protein
MLSLLLTVLLLVVTTLVSAGQFGETLPSTFGEVNLCVPPRDGNAPIPGDAFALMTQRYRTHFGSAGQDFDEPGRVGACCGGYCLVLSHGFSAEREGPEGEGIEAPFRVTGEQWEDAILQLAGCVDLAAEGGVALFGRLLYDGGVGR